MPKAASLCMRILTFPTQVRLCIWNDLDDMGPEKVFIFLKAPSFSLISLLTVPRYQNEVQTSEMFSTAGRTVRSGLVASAVVSSWTW